VVCARKSALHQRSVSPVVGHVVFRSQVSENGCRLRQRERIVLQTGHLPERIHGQILRCLLLLAVQSNQLHLDREPCSPTAPMRRHSGAPNAAVVSQRVQRSSGACVARPSCASLELTHCTPDCRDDRLSWRGPRLRRHSFHTCRVAYTHAKAGT